MSADENPESGLVSMTTIAYAIQALQNDRESLEKEFAASGSAELADLLEEFRGAQKELKDVYEELYLKYPNDVPYGMLIGE